MKSPKTIRMQINTDALPGYDQGIITTVVVDDYGVPKEKFWRDRLLDAETDNCVEIVQPKSTTTKTSTKESS